MNFEYSSEQQQLADSVDRFVEREYDFERRKAIIASEAGWSEQVWNGLVELGLTALAVPEEHGGLGAGAMDLLAPMQAIGRGLLVEPFLSTIGVPARVIARAGSASQKETLLAQVAEGTLKLAFAHVEPGARHSLSRVRAEAARTADGWTLSGDKRVVLHAPMADRLLVTARVSGAAGDEAGLSLFLVDARAPGVSMKTCRTVDNFRAADVLLENVRVGPDALVGAEGQGFEALDEAVDYATALLCAEAVGAMDFANATTLEYLKTRRQFGVPIGSFQALQHRMVDMTISAEQSRSITYLACAKVDAAARGELTVAERRRFVSAAKVKVADACRHVGQEAVQLHGGMGMTQEMKVAHTFKRLTMIAQAFGDAEHHLERFAKAA